MYWKTPLFTLCLVFAAVWLTAQSSADIPRFLHKRGAAIQLSDTTDFSDLRKLANALRGKRVVLLGESTHGAREMNLLKNRLIRFLHEELDFKVLLFESGIGEIFGLDQQRATLSADKLRFAGLMGPWQSEAFTSLMAYAKAHPELALAGFDVQRTGASFTAILDAMDRDLSLPDAATLAGTETIFSGIRQQLIDRKVTADEQLEAEQTRAIEALTLARQTILEHTTGLIKKGWDRASVALAARSLQNRIDFIRIYYQFKLDNNYVNRFAARDSVMAENVLWLTREIYPDQKIIISAHNHHIARFNERDFVMGERLAGVFGNHLHAIGLFPGSGSFANNSRATENMESSGAWNDLQHIIGQMREALLWLKIPRKATRKSAWLFEPVTINNTFINIWGDKQLTLADSFDSLFFFREISPAVYEGSR